MLKTKILYQLNSDNSGEVIQIEKNTSTEINHHGLVFFIQVTSSKPIDFLNEHQKSLL